MSRDASNVCWMVVPACGRQDKANWRAADEAMYRAGYRTVSSRVVCGGDAAKTKSKAESLAASISEAIGHAVTVTECIL